MLKNLRLGGQKGRATVTPDSTHSAPGPQVEMEPREDVFAVYEGYASKLERSPSVALRQEGYAAFTELPGGG
jgi:hypothetical protein